MKILAFDTTNITLSVAIIFNHELISQRNILEENKHSEMLIPTIEECLNEAQIWYQDLDLIAFSNGPGSFTGIRVGYSCAKALAIATDLPIFAVSSLAAIAYSYLENKQKILVVNDARLEEFFIQEFTIQDNKLVASFKPKLIAQNDLNNFIPKEKFILAGSAKNMIKDKLPDAIMDVKNDFIDAKNIAFLAKQNYDPNQNQKSDALYIRKPKISKRK